MKRWHRAVLAALTAASPPVAAQDAGSLELDRVRFYRGGGETLVEAFLRVPVGWLRPLPPPGHGTVYRVSVSVRDSSGAQLMSESWSQGVSAAVLQRPDAFTVEDFRFAAQPGGYTVEVAVTDSASQRVSRVRDDFVTFPAAPLASDLLLASRMRQALSGPDTVARDGEIRKGSLFLESSGHPTLTPDQSALGYYLELYPPRAASAMVRVRVTGAAGNQVVATEPRSIGLAAGGGATWGLVELGGLPPGDYRLDVVVTTPDSELVRSAAFAVARFRAEGAPPGRGVGDVFAVLAERGLDSLYEPLIYVMTSEERGIYSTLTVSGKRTFLRRFWAMRDPTPETPQNEAMAGFYASIAEANRRFREGGAARIDGWRTDRGRIFIRYGPPDEVLSRPQSVTARAYEVWKYTRVRARKFVFFDVTSFGHYELIWTDERREPSRPNWDALLGPEAVDDVRRF